MLNCLIVDDDEITRLEVEKLVNKTPFLKLVKSCESAMEALHQISENQVDLIFLDVLMPEMTGLEFLKILHKNSPQIILMTLNKEYALDAFEYEVTDFITKPISEERFLKATGKAIRNHNSEKNNRNAGGFIFARVNSNLVKINTIELLYVQVAGDYLLLHTASNSYTIHSSLKSLLEKLPENEFMRVHNSYIVRLDKISSIEGSTIVINKKLIPVSRNNKEELMTKLNLI